MAPRKRVPEVFRRVMELVEAMDSREAREPGAGSPSETFARAFGPHWTVSVNMSAVPARIVAEGMSHVAVVLPPKSVVVWHRGWLAGLFNETGGMLANIMGATEADLVALVRDATEKERSAR